MTMRQRIGMNKDNKEDKAVDSDESIISMYLADNDDIIQTIYTDDDKDILGYFTVVVSPSSIISKYEASDYAKLLAALEIMYFDMKQQLIAEIKKDSRPIYPGEPDA